MSEIKAQPVGADQGAGLVHMLAQDLFQGPVQQMSCSMAAADPAAADSFHPGGDGIAGGKAPALHLPFVDNLSGRSEESPDNDGPPLFRFNHPAVPDLPARFGVKGSAVKKDLHGISFRGCLPDLSVH